MAMESRNLDPEVAHGILQNRRRRRVLEHVNKVPGTVTVRDLAEKIAEAESGESPPPQALRRSVYNSLHQHHLPKLDEANVIAYDKDRKTVDILENAKSISLYMEVVTPYGITWAEYYRSLAVLGLLVIVAHDVGVPVIADLPGLLIPVVFLTIVGLSTGYQLWSQRWMYLNQLFD